MSTQTAGKLGVSPQGRAETGYETTQDKPSAGIKRAIGSGRTSKTQRKAVKTVPAPESERGARERILQALVLGQECTFRVWIASPNDLPPLPQMIRHAFCGGRQAWVSVGQVWPRSTLDRPNFWCVVTPDRCLDTTIFGRSLTTLLPKPSIAI